MKTLHIAIISIFIITSIASNVSVFADNGTLRLGPPPKIPIQQVYPSQHGEGYTTTWPNIHGISLTLTGMEQRQGSKLTLTGSFLANSLIELDLHAPDGRIVQSETTMTDKNGVFSSFDLKIPLNATLGIWNINATSGNMFGDMQFNVEPRAPLKQLESGTNPSEIQCDLGFILVIQAGHGFPACVKLDTAQKLLERGWENKIVSNKMEVFPNLKLIFSTNSSSVQSGHAIGIDISLNNTSTAAFSLRDRNLWSYNNLSLDSCSNLPIGIAILKGYYTLQNMSGATSLWLYPNLPCPAPVGVSGYTFQPLSDTAARDCNSSSPCYGPVAVEGHLAISGYLSGNGNTTPFQTGDYTIVGGDEWGDVAIQHFTIVNSTDIQTKNNTSQAIPSCVSNIPHQYATAGAPGFFMCPIVAFHATGQIVNYTGFYGVYNYTKFPNTQNFVLEPGHNGTISYEISINSIRNWANTAPSGEINITNYVQLMHDANMYDHPGVYVTLNPRYEIVPTNSSAFITITLAASKDASHGTYWVHLPPGVCSGGETIILTVTDCTSKK